MPTPAPVVLAQAFREFYDPRFTVGVPEQFTATPLWQVWIVTLLLCLLAAEVGFRVGRWMRPRTVSEPEAPVRSMVGAAMALLAFLLAFTFNLAATRHQTRQDLVLDEVSALRSALLRSSFLPQPEQDQCRALLKKYVEVLIEADRTGLLRVAVKRSDEIRQELVAEVASLARADARSTSYYPFVESLETVFKFGARRVSVGLRTRIPPPIWIALSLLTGLALITEGYLNGLTGSRRAPALVSIVLSISLVIVLIADLDNPGMGLLRVSHVALEEVLQEMR